MSLCRSLELLERSGETANVHLGEGVTNQLFTFLGTILSIDDGIAAVPIKPLVDEIALVRVVGYSSGGLWSSRCRDACVPENLRLHPQSVSGLSLPHSNGTYLAVRAIPLLPPSSKTEADAVNVTAI